MTEQIEQQIPQEQIQEKQEEKQEEIKEEQKEIKEEPKTTEPEDQFGLTDILKLLEQPQKVQQISNNQKEVFVSFLFF